MTSRIWKYLIAPLLLLSAPLCPAQASSSRPNIIIILADDLGFSDLGCYGSELSTPNLNRLAESGVRFTQFYNTPRCCPSRAALLTGLYPQQAGMGGMMEDRGIPGYHGELNDRCVTMAEVLRTAGYHTLMVGKWHLCHIFFDGKKQLNYETNEPYWENKNDWPLQRGFEEYYGTIHGVCSYFDPFSLVHDNTPTKPDSTNFYYTDALADHAVAYIDKYASRKEPFFMYTAFTAPHWPMQAPEADIAKYRKIYEAGWDQIRTNRYHKEIELGIINKDWPLSPRDPRVQPWENVPNKDWQANRMATFAAMVEHLDTGVGRIMKELEAKHIADNTLVIFLSDNGACDEVIQPVYYDVPSRTRDGRPVKVGNGNPSVFAGPDDVWQSYGVPWANVSDTPFRLYKHFAHEGGISSPFLARWPAVIKNKGSLVAQIGHITDLMPTVVEIANAKYPREFKSNPIPHMAGESLLPIFEGKTRRERTPIYWEHEGNRAIHSGHWKLVARWPGPWELYDIEKDRTEMNNLADSNPEKVKELAALYDDWANRCNVLPPDKLPPPRKIKPAGETAD